MSAAGVPYAVIGGNAVQYWAAQVDESVVRNPRDVNIVLNRADLPAAIAALEKAGFLYRHTAGVTMFLDGPDAKARDAVRVVFAGEKVRADYPAAVPTIIDVVMTQRGCTLPLESLDRMKLTSPRDKDRVHVRDMISVSLIDETWLERFSPPLQARLKELLDNPDG